MTDFFSSSDFTRDETGKGNGMPSLQKVEQQLTSIFS